jgi:arabinofuranosyltransferase
VTRRLDRVLALCLVPAALLAVAGWRLRWVNEDGFIYLRIADNLLSGHGPVFNSGERVEAYTGPLWLALLTVVGGLVRSFVSLEHIAVVLGIALSAGGLAAASLGALRLARALGADRRVAPLGALVVAALPPFWDYATSGLETGMVLAWMGGTFWGLCGRLEEPRRGRLAPLAAAIGLGPLVRPDLGVFAVGFLLALLLLARPGRAGVLRALAAAAALPVAYQLFRMGYFASIVPNTALAKEAGLAFWSRGWAYFLNTIGPYALWLPLAVLLAMLALALRRAPGRAVRIVALAPVACAAVQAIYVIRLGGDYMHARMLLPAVFGVLLPVAVTPLPRGPWALVPVVLVGGWALTCAIALRAPSNAAESPQASRFLDQRRKREPPPGHSHFVTLADYQAQPFSQPWIGEHLKALAAKGRGALVTDYRRETVTIEGHPVVVRTPVPLRGARPRAPWQHDVIAYTGSIGRVGYAAGDRVHVVDRLGLADPIGARLRLVGPRHGEAGHEKALPVEWFYGRFADGRAPGGQGVEAARRAVRCGALGGLLRGTTAPLTVDRFLDNVGLAVRDRALRIPRDPRAAARELCGPRRARRSSGARRPA